jgi:hypothetical protein
LAESADLIAYALDLHVDEGRRILRAHRQDNADTPVVVFTSGASEASVVSGGDGISTIPWPTSVRGQTQMFHAALATSGRDAPTLRLNVHGPVTSADHAYALRALGSFEYGNASAHIVHVDLVRVTDPAWERPALARAVLDCDGQLVWVHADAATMSEAITRLGERVRARIAPLVAEPTLVDLTTATPAR